jgi:SAM-dependent methyltransferase
MDEPSASPLTQRVERVVQVISDISGDRVSDSRVLDLGCYDGNCAIAVGRLGAREVIGIEGRAENLSPGIAVRDAEGLSQVQLITDDVRSLSVERHGKFDVVLCLGILYHLDAPAVFEFARQVASVCRGYALIETQIGLTRKAREEWEGRRYEGFWYPEDPSQPGAALDNPRSFWPTKASLLNLLADVGFTSVAEVLSPPVTSLIPYEDHTLLVAFKGAPHGTAPRWPSATRKTAHPTQGLRYVVRDRLARVRGAGLPSMFERQRR